MQVIYGDASNINLTAQKRLIRVVYGQTQATPYAGTLDTSLRNTEGTIVVPKSTDTSPFTRSADAYTFNGSLVPGLCMVKTTGEAFAVASGGKKEKVFGLLAQWIGGTFDNIKGSNQIAVWNGVDSVYDILAPAFDSTSVSTKAAENKAGTPVYLYPGTDGRLTVEAGSERTAVAELIELINPSVLRIKLLV